MVCGVTGFDTHARPRVPLASNLITPHPSSILPFPRPISFERIAHPGTSDAAACGTGGRAGSGGDGGAAPTAGGARGANTAIMDTKGNVDIKLSISATNLDKKDFGLFGKSDPYFILSRAAVPQIYRSETVRSSLNPVWQPFNGKYVHVCQPSTHVSAFAFLRVDNARWSMVII